jgi:hypothetical protein
MMRYSLKKNRNSSDSLICPLRNAPDADDEAEWDETWIRENGCLKKYEI